MHYTFTLVYQLDTSDSDMSSLIERLGAEGCTDALPGLGQNGWLALEFAREAPSATLAIDTALADVRRALPTAQLIEAAPDLVGISDVAALTGVSRQNMRKLLFNHLATAPRPVHAGNPSLWHLCDLLEWLSQRESYVIPASVLDIARAAEQVNARREAARVTAVT